MLNFFDKVKIVAYKGATEILKISSNQMSKFIPIGDMTVRAKYINKKLQKDFFFRRIYTINITYFNSGKIVVNRGTKNELKYANYKSLSKDWDMNNLVHILENKTPLERINNGQAY